MILTSGASFGPYRILGLIGSGGMGEVYRARDTRLKRDIALKVLVDRSADLHQIHRFEQEARAASTLNHPNIVVIYEFGEVSLNGWDAPLRYLTMELLDGEALDATVRRGALPLRRVLDLATQIAAGLARAHESGIVHRDLKPSNIVVTSDGRAKILDFGLAKLRRDEVATDTSVETVSHTTPGAMLGTAGYMSPEQARGEPVTAANDQFSFGCILYEMLTGHSAFRKKSAAETLSSILRDEPTPIEQLAPATPVPLRWILERCLAKEASDRYASTRDLARDLKTLLDHHLTGRPATDVSVAPPRADAFGRRKLVAALAAAGLLLIAAAVAIGRNVLSRPDSHVEFRRLTLRQGFVSRALFVPASSWILYSASWEGQPSRTYMTLPESAGIDRPLDSEIQLPLAYSKDGTQVLVLLGVPLFAFNARATLAWWPAQGGKPRPILDDVGWADWAPEGRFLVVVRVTSAGRILELRGADGALRRELFRTPGAISCVRLSPDEKTLAFIHHPSPVDNAGEVMLVPLDGAAPRVVSPRFLQCAGLVWNRGNGRVWFTASLGSEHSGSIWEAGSSAKARRVYASPDNVILQDLSPEGDRALVSTTQDEMRLLVRRAGEPPRDVTWFRWSVVTDVSADGSRALLIEAGPTERSSGTWLRPLDGGDAVRLGDVEFARFSPDGQSVVAVTPASAGPQRLVLMPVGPGQSFTLASSGANYRHPSFAGPGTILYVRSDGEKSGVFRIGTDGGGERSLGAPDCDHPSASPDASSFVCIGGDQPRTLLVFPTTRGAGRKLYELAAPGTFVVVRWSNDASRILAVTKDRRLLTVDAGTGALVREELLPLPDARGWPTGNASLAALSADGSVQAYSVRRHASSLYVVSGLR